MSTTHFAMIAVAAAVLAGAWFARRPPRLALAAGFGLWVATAAYFAFEPFAIAATTAAYDPLWHPMSALGVTECGVSFAEYPVCSPLHELVNWVFVLNGVMASAAAVVLHQFWPRTRRAATATVLLVFFGLSNAATGLVPADVNLEWHVILALPSMVVQVPALLLLATTTWRQQRAFSVFTAVCALVSAAAGPLTLLQLGFPGGLAQRVMYGAVWLWGIVAAVVWWRRRLASEPHTKGEGFLPPPLSIYISPRAEQDAPGSFSQDTGGAQSPAETEKPEAGGPTCPTARSIFPTTSPPKPNRRSSPATNGTSP